jgi:exopolysaccharide transport family protein
MSGVQTTSDVDVDLRELFASLARKWPRILAVSLIVAGIAFALAWVATPLYMGETRILIETRESPFTRPDNTTEADRPILDEEGVTSQVEIIGSTDILKQVANKLELHKLKEFDPAVDMSLFTRLMVIAGLVSDPNDIPPDERVLKAMREKLDVYRVENSRVIVIEFSSEDPKLAAAVPNAIAEAYIAVSRDAKLASNSDATEWLEPEIADLRTRVKEAELRVAGFRSQHDLLIGDNSTQLSTQQLAELSTELSRVRANRGAAEANAESVRSAIENGASLDALPEVLSSTLIQRLRERQVELKAQIADLSTTLLDGHPRIRALRSQLVDLDSQIRSEAQKVLQGLENEANTAQFREKQLIADLNTLKAESARAGDQTVELRALEREAAAQRELLESYLTRYREAASRRDGNYLPVDARIFSRAIAPAEPYFPNILPIVGAAFAASLLIMAIVTLLQELFSGRAMRPAGPMIEPIVEVEMPQVRQAEPRVVEPVSVGSADPLRAADSVVAESLAARPGTVTERTTITQETVAIEPVAAQVAMAAAEPPKRASSMLNIEPARPAKRVMSSLGEIGVDRAAEKLIAGGAARAIFVSPEGDEAAATSVLVAREVADAGLRVLLLDLTASGAASKPMLEGAVKRGITDLLASEAQFSDVIHADYYSDCHVIPLGTANPARAMRAADRLPMIMNSLTTAYDVVVVECGPTDAEGIRRLVADGTEVMVSVLEPSDTAIAETAAALEASGYGKPILVTPVGYEPPYTPVPGRKAA